MNVYIVTTEEIEENGIVYVVETYSNGAIVKYIKPIGEPQPEILHLNDTEEAILETALNVEYLVCLAELGL